MNDDIVLPTAATAVEDEADSRPIVSILHNGRIVVKGKVHHDPEIHGHLEDPYEDVKKWLATTASGMQTDHLNKQSGVGPMVPDEPILIRADRSAPFRYIQKVMEFCGAQGVHIWKIQLACRTPEGAAGKLLAYLPRDVGVIDAAPVERVEVLVRVRETGRKLFPGEEREPYTDETGERRFDWDDEQRVLQYSVGPVRTEKLSDLSDRLKKIHEHSERMDPGSSMPVTIDARPGTCYGDIVPVIDALLEAGFTGITFVGAYDDYVK